MTKSSPPASIEELREEYFAIQRADGRKRLGRRSLEVLKCMLDFPELAAVRSISMLAEDVGVSSSVATRMAQKLGYEGFPALQEVFRQAVNRRKYYYSEQVKHFLERRSELSASNGSQPFERTVRSEWGNVMQSLENFDRRQYSRAVHLLDASQNVFVLGMRSSYPMAYYFAYYLKMIRSGVTVLDNMGNAIAENLVEAGGGDMLFAVGVHPYTKLTVDACRVARKQGMDVVALTDSLSSPLGHEADTVLLISAQSDTYFSSITAGNLYIATLLSEMVGRLGADAVQRLRANEELLDELGIEFE